jgi:hypothetical protein
MIGDNQVVSYLDVLLVLLLFLWPPMTVLITFTLREWWRLRRERNLSDWIGDASHREGYPPPCPPTTDSLSDDCGTVQSPLNPPGPGPASGPGQAYLTRRIPPEASPGRRRAPRGGRHERPGRG